MNQISPSAAEKLDQVDFSMMKIMIYFALQVIEDRRALSYTLISSRTQRK
jgi:hypothetical protein